MVVDVVPFRQTRVALIVSGFPFALARIVIFLMPCLVFFLPLSRTTMLVGSAHVKEVAPGTGVMTPFVALNRVTGAGVHGVPVSVA